MRIKKIFTAAGTAYARVRLLFMAHFMFDRLVREENMRWQKKSCENRGK